MKLTRKAFALLLVVALVFSISISTFAEDAAPPSSYEGKVVILHTNDTHGRVAYNKEAGIIGFDGLAALKAKYESLGAEVFVMDAGDATQGAPVVNLYKGQNVIEFMNAVGYDAAAVGNHEFDYTFNNLLKMQDAADYPLLAANLTYKSDGGLVLEDNTVLTTANGLRIGVFGIDTSETMTKASPQNTALVSFGTSAEDLYDTAQAQVNTLENEDCDIIVCLGHLGTDASSAPYRSTDLLANVTGIDLFIDGHSHTVMQSGIMIDDTLLVSTGEYFENVGLVIYDPSAGSFNASLISAKTADITPVAGISAIIKEYSDEVDAQYSEVFASTEVDLNGTRTGGDVKDETGQVVASFPEGEGVRTAETNMGDYATDAILWQARETIGDQVVASITNGGGIRETISKGYITKNDLITVYPFGNEVTVLTLTGTQLLEVLEAATWCTPTSIGAFPQVSGIEFTIDTTIDYTNGELYPNSTYYSPGNAGSRVTITSIGGKQFDANANYTIATNNYSADGGDTYFAFTQASYRYDTGVSLEDALINYTQTVLNSVIGEQYAEPQGRINIIESPYQRYADLKANAWYKEPVTYNLENGYIVGLSDTVFSPDTDMTRIQFMTLMYRIGQGLGFYEDAVTTGDDWEMPGTQLASDLGLGWTSNEIGQSITREEICTVGYIVLYSQFSGDYNLVAQRDYTAFSDENSVNPDYLYAVKNMYIAGGVNGYPDGTFRPLGTAKRCEIAKLVYNMLEVVQVVSIAEVA